MVEFYSEVSLQRFPNLHQFCMWILCALLKLFCCFVATIWFIVPSSSSCQTHNLWEHCHLYRLRAFLWILPSTHDVQTCFIIDSCSSKSLTITIILSREIRKFCIAALKVKTNCDINGKKLGIFVTTKIKKNTGIWCRKKSTD